MSLKVAEVEGQLQVNKIGEDKHFPIVFIDQLYSVTTRMAA